MKGLFGIVSLLLTLLIVGVLVKKQLATTHLSVPGLQQNVPANPDGAASGPAATTREQAQQVQQQYKLALEAAMPPPAPPDDK